MENAPKPALSANNAIDIDAASAEIVSCLLIVSSVRCVAANHIICLGCIATFHNETELTDLVPFASAPRLTAMPNRQTTYIRRG